MWAVFPLVDWIPQIPLSQNPPRCKPFTGHDCSGHEILWRMSLGDLMILNMLTQWGGSDAKEAHESGDISPFSRIVPLRCIGDVGWIWTPLWKDTGVIEGACRELVSEASFVFLLFSVHIHYPFCRFFFPHLSTMSWSLLETNLRPTVTLTVLPVYHWRGSGETVARSYPCIRICRFFYCFFYFLSIYLLC